MALRSSFSVSWTLFVQTDMFESFGFCIGMHRLRSIKSQKPKACTRVFYRKEETNNRSPRFSKHLHDSTHQRPLTKEALPCESLPLLGLPLPPWFMVVWCALVDPRSLVSSTIPGFVCFVTWNPGWAVCFWEAKTEIWDELCICFVLFVCWLVWVGWLVGC